MASESYLNGTALTERERAVLEQLSLGKTYRQAGAALFISETTIKSHLAKIFRKYNASNKAEAVTIALRKGDIVLRTNGRPSLDSVLMDSARLWANRSTCNRLHTGAVIAHDGRILSTGYNGVPSGLPHCDHKNPESTNPRDACTLAVHAEANAIAFAARKGIAIQGATMYATHQPCPSCAQIIINSGIYTVFYEESYRRVEGLNLLSAAGVRVLRFPREK